MFCCGTKDNLDLSHNGLYKPMRNKRTNKVIKTSYHFDKEDKCKEMGVMLDVPEE